MCVFIGFEPCLLCVLKRESPDKSGLYITLHREFGGIGGPSQRTEGQDYFCVTATVCVSWLSASQVTTGSIHLAISPTCS